MRVCTFVWGPRVQRPPAWNLALNGTPESCLIYLLHQPGKTFVQWMEKLSRSGIPPLPLGVPDIYVICRSMQSHATSQSQRFHACGAFLLCPWRKRCNVRWSSESQTWISLFQLHATSNTSGPHSASAMVECQAVTWDGCCEG